LRFRPDRRNVQANLIGSQNGQSQSEPRPEGRFTGQRLLRERPRVYRKVVELLAEPGMSINQITKLCRVSEHTVRADRDREAVSIAERKQQLISIYGSVAEIAAERMASVQPKDLSSDAKDTASKALPSAPDPEAARPAASAQPAEGCARKERLAQKEKTGMRPRYSEPPLDECLTNRSSFRAF
jgi:septal ring-binding cell division protein DamX